MGRPRKYSDEQIIAALKKKKGMVYHAAAAAGCDPDTIYERAKVSPAVAAVMRHERGSFVDTAEMKLYDAVEAGEAWAVQMALKTLGKDRGYVERTESHVSGEVKAVTEVVVRTRQEAAALLASLAPPPGEAPP